MTQLEGKPRVYTSAMMALYPILLALLIVVIPFQVYAGLANAGLAFLVYLVLIEGIAISYFICMPYEVEIHQEGLILRYYWRTPRVVAWSKIWRVVVRYNRGAWCTIRYGSGLWDRAIFCVDYGFWFTSGKADQFLHVIADAANLTIVGHTFWGRPIYGRQLK